MKVAFVQQFIRTNLGETFQEAGFLFQKRYEGFVRMTENGFEEIGIEVIDYEPNFWLRPLIDVRLNAVADIAVRFLRRNPKFAADYTTFRIDYSFFKGESFSEYVVASENELRDAVRNIGSVALEKVLPFFESHCDAESIETFVNGPGWEFVTDPQPDKAIVSCILAQQCGRENLKELIDRHASEMSEYLEEIKRPFFDCVEYLRTGMYPHRDDDEAPADDNERATSHERERPSTEKEVKLSQKHEEILLAAKNVLLKMPEVKGRIFRAAELTANEFPCALVYGAQEREDLDEQEREELQNSEILLMWVELWFVAASVSEDEDDLDAADDVLGPILDEMVEKLSHNEALLSLVSGLDLMVREVEGSSDDGGSFFTGSLMFEVTTRK